MYLKIGDEVVYIKDGEIGVVTEIGHRQFSSYTVHIEYPKSGQNSSCDPDGTRGGYPSVRLATKLDKALL